MPTFDGGQMLQAYSSSPVSRDSETRSHYTQMAIGECERGWSTVARQRDAAAYFKGNAYFRYAEWQFEIQMWICTNVHLSYIVLRH